VLVVAPVQGLPLLPAVALGVLAPWLFRSAARPTRMAGLLLALLLANYAWWTASLVLGGNLGRLFGDLAFVRWQLRGLACFLPLAAWLCSGHRLSEPEGRYLAWLTVLPAAFVAAAGAVSATIGVAPSLLSDLDFSVAPVRRVHDDLWFFGLHRSHLAAAGFYSTVAVVLIVWLGVVPMSRKVALALGGALAVILWALAMTKARAPLLGFACACALLVVIGIARRKHLGRLSASAALALVFTVAASMASPDTRERWRTLGAPVPVDAAAEGASEVATVSEMRRRFGDATGALASANASDRRVYWRAAADFARTHPWTGIGLGNFARDFATGAYRLAVPPPRPEMAHGHNVLLHVAAETGVPGAVLLLLLWLALIAGLVHKARLAVPSSFAAVLAIAACAACVVQTVAGVADLTLWSPSVMLPMMTIAGAALSAAGRVDAEVDLERRATA
jgi:hypothetical protein